MARTHRNWNCRLAVTLRDSELQPADVFGKGFDPGAVLGVDSELAARIDALLGDGASATLEADELRQKCVWTLTIVDDGYPHALVARLGDQAPPVLLGCRVPTLMDTPGIGVVGSRDVNEFAADIVQAVARGAVSLGRPVVSGGARGVDQLAMNAAFVA